MTTPDIAGLCERLRAALEGVTPGTWYATDPEDNPSAIKADLGLCSVYVADAMRPSDQAFIARANPETLTALLDTLERQAAEIERLRDKVEGLESDLRCAVQVAYNRGATEWARLNYPDMIEWLESCAEARAALTGEDHD